ncbi:MULTISPECIES: hypothetical protein [unclassified Streptomyces]|uniref:hypothetical protein n=1 Tax=unclassified Streptomyces TaxID=2593676 RepID=UPI0038297AC7
MAGDLPGEDVAVGLRGDGGEDQALGLDRLQHLHPLHRATGSPCLPSVAGSP